MVAIALMASGATAARADDAQKARELFTQGNTYFDLGQFDKALAQQFICPQGRVGRLAGRVPAEE